MSNANMKMVACQWQQNASGGVSFLSNIGNEGFKSSLTCFGLEREDSKDEWSLDTACEVSEMSRGMCYFW